MKNERELKLKLLAPIAGKNQYLGRRSKMKNDGPSAAFFVTLVIHT
jgi:hypothetical protein